MGFSGWRTGDDYFTLDTKTLIAMLECHDKGNIGLTILTAVHKALGLSRLWYKKLDELLPHYDSACSIPD